MNELRRRLGESLRVSGPIWTASLVIERILPVNLLGRWPQTRVPVERLRAQVLAILGAWGMPEVEAKTTADHLIYPDLCGIDSHGVAMLLHYQRALSDGSMRIPAAVTVLTEGPSTALLDGGGGLGHLPADRAMRMAIAKARETGVAAVAVRSSGHFGAAGSYAAMASEAGLLGLVTTNTQERAVVPTFAADAMLGTNAISFAAPSEAGRGFLLDIATSTASMGKVLTRWREGRRIPPGGPSTLGAAQSGTGVWRRRSGGSRRSAAGPRMRVTKATVSPRWSRSSPPPCQDRAVRNSGVGHFFWALDPGRFRQDDRFEGDLDRLADSLRAARPLSPGRPVLVAGDPEREVRDHRLRAGIPLSRSVIEDLRTVARRSRVPFSL